MDYWFERFTNETGVRVYQAVADTSIISWDDQVLVDVGDGITNDGAGIYDAFFMVSEEFLQTAAEGGRLPFPIAIIS